jgi:GNAT superfamily N-acetyltransferase
MSARIRPCDDARVLSYRIRPAGQGDLGFLADVVIAVTRAQDRLPAGFDERQWRDGFIADSMEQISGAVPGCTVCVIEVGGRRVGRLRVVRTADAIELCGIQLLPDTQRHGIGTAIIEALKAEAAAAGLPLHLSVEKDNPDASRLYRRLGFAMAGETADECRLRWDPRS